MGKRKKTKTPSSLCWSRRSHSGHHLHQGSTQSQQRGRRQGGEHPSRTMRVEMRSPINPIPHPIIVFLSVYVDIRKLWSMKYEKFSDMLIGFGTDKGSFSIQQMFSEKVNCFMISSSEKHIKINFPITYFHCSKLDSTVMKNSCFQSCRD